MPCKEERSGRCARALQEREAGRSDDFAGLRAKKSPGCLRSQGPDVLVELAGVEPASANRPRTVLHAYLMNFRVSAAAMPSAGHPRSSRLFSTPPSRLRRSTSLRNMALLSVLPDPALRRTGAASRWIKQRERNARYWRLLLSELFYEDLGPRHAPCPFVTHVETKAAPGKRILPAFRISCEAGLAPGENPMGRGGSPFVSGKGASGAIPACYPARKNPPGCRTGGIPSSLPPGRAGGRISFRPEGIRT